MKILTVSFSIEGEASIKQGPAIDLEGMLWLISGWVQNQEEGYAIPKRLIALDPFRLQRFQKTTPFGDAASNLPIPKGLFDYPIPSQLEGKFPVLEEPDIKFYRKDMPTTH